MRRFARVRIRFFNPEVDRDPMRHELPPPSQELGQGQGGPGLLRHDNSTPRLP